MTEQFKKFVEVVHNGCERGTEWNGKWNWREYVAFIEFLR